MNDVNWWLMALAFVLGLALTLAFMIRRVVREVPVYGAAGASAAANLVGTKPKATEADVDLPDAELPKASASGTGAVAAGAAGVAGAAKLVGSRGSGAGDEEPYGAGSLRLAAGADAPAGYTIKANEDSMLYHTTDSPSYAQTVAELWFTEESAAKKAGFTRWDAVATPRRRSWSAAGASMRATPRRPSWSVAGAAMRAKSPTAQALCGWPRVRPMRLPATRSRATRIRCSITRPTARPTSRRSPRCGSATPRLRRRRASTAGTAASPNADRTRGARTGLGVAAAAGRRQADSAPKMPSRHAIRPAGQPAPGRGPSRSATPSTPC